MAQPAKTILSPPLFSAAADDRYSGITRLFQSVIIFLFLAGLFTPLAGTFVGLDPWRAFNEKRQLAAFPPWPTSYSQIPSYLPNVFSYYRDHFGFRDSMIHAMMKVEVGLFGVSGTPDVIIGEDGWLYLRLKSDPSSAKTALLTPFTDADLQSWQQLLERRQAWLASKHISYLVLIAPEKQSIYPEFLSAQLRKFQYDTRMNQLIQRLRETHSPVLVVDVRSDLLAAKRYGPVYWKADTHWNNVGAYVVYRDLMSQIHLALPAKPLIILEPADLSRIEATGLGGDLANMLGVPEMYSEKSLTMTPLGQTLPARNGEDQLYVLNGDPHGPRLVLYHDSFAVELVPLMARSFSHGVYFWGSHTINPDFIATHAPDIVIDEIAERFLFAEHWQDPELPDQANPR
jgi:alginate O-acetyltransferase complex protein AlgJ